LVSKHGWYRSDTSGNSNIGIILAKWCSLFKKTTAAVIMWHLNTHAMEHDG
jgi:hypothetical protein